MIIESNEVGDITFLSLTNQAGLRVTLSNYGAGIYEIRYDGAAMTIGNLDKKAWMASPSYFGKSVGRIAGRIAKGDLAYLGKHYKLTINEGKNTLHGGASSFAYKTFKMDVVHLGEDVAVDFYLVSPALEGGFPGEVSLRIRYLVSETKPELKVTYEAKASEETPLNFTNHSYFNIGGEPNMEKQLLWVDSDETETYDPELIPLGFKKSPSCLNFMSKKAVGKDVDAPLLHEGRTGGYDHCFKFKKNNRKDPVVTLENDVYKMSIITSLPAIQIYSDNYPKLGEPLTSGHPEVIHAGLAMEPVYCPDDFHSMTAFPFESKKNFILYRFEKKGE
jgi:aldose 1-epimerase